MTKQTVLTFAEISLIRTAVNESIAGMGEGEGEQKYLAKLHRVRKKLERMHLEAAATTRGGPYASIMKDTEYIKKGF